MGTEIMSKESPYANSCILLTTKHAKSIAIAPAFQQNLRANVLEYFVDTDLLGTFTGEIEREGNALDCVKKKCQWAVERLGSRAEFFLASEGSFFPHPHMPFFTCNQEVLYFIDRSRDFHLHLTMTSLTTNYNKAKVKSLDELEQFAKEIGFPEHGLILRLEEDAKGAIIKGLTEPNALKQAFIEMKKYSKEGDVMVETDMRAHMNPTRMKVIEELAAKLSERLATSCPSCALPGWGIIGVEKGLACSLCGLKTELIQTETYGCVKCHCHETKERADGLKEASPEYCAVCNP